MASTCVGLERLPKEKATLVNLNALSQNGLSVVVVVIVSERGSGDVCENPQSITMQRRSLGLIQMGQCLCTDPSLPCIMHPASSV